MINPVFYTKIYRRIYYSFKGYLELTEINLIGIMRLQLSGVGFLCVDLDLRLKPSPQDLDVNCVQRMLNTYSKIMLTPDLGAVYILTRGGGFCNLSSLNFQV